MAYPGLSIPFALIKHVRGECFKQLQKIDPNAAPFFFLQEYILHSTTHINIDHNALCSPPRPYEPLARVRLYEFYRTFTVLSREQITL